MKKVPIKAKPKADQQINSADKWVSSRETAEEDKEDLKRLTIDVPATLHRRIKSQCADRGLKMADEIRELLDKHFPITS